MTVLAVCALAIAGCKNEAPKQDLAAIQMRDSLNQIIAQKDNEINDMISTFSDIEEGFREITDAQNRVTLAQQGEGTNSAKRIKENMQFIQQTMRQNKELINKLKQQLREQLQGRPAEEAHREHAETDGGEGSPDAGSARGTRQEGHPYC